MSKQYSDSDEVPFACDLTALNAEQRIRYAQIREQLHESVQEVRELTNGYSFRYPADDPMIPLLAEFISLERRCCPFLDFTMNIERKPGPVWLALTGPSGVKEFLRAEMGIDELPG